jgi:hypothetical protein
MSEPPTAHFARDLDRQTPVSTTGPGTGSPPRDLLRILVLIAALGIAVLGLLGGGIGLLLSLFRHDADSLSIATLSISLLVLTVGLGSVLAWHTWRAIRGYASPAFRPGKIGFLVLLLLLSLVLGQMILSLHLLPVITFPLFHVSATILPALIILALVGRGLGGITSRRDVVLQIASGAFLGAPLAFALEAVALSSLLGAAIIGLVARPGGQELIQTLTTYLQDPALLQEPSLLAPVFNSLAILAVVFVFVAGIVPLIEEGVKTVGVGLMAYRKPTLSQAFLWGLAGGTGFAIVEGLLNTTGGLAAWTPMVLLRIGATLLHCFTGALMGIAWYNVLQKRRWAQGFGLYAASVALHSLWNALTIGMVLLSLGQLGTDPTEGNQMMAEMGIVIMLVLLAVLALALALALLGLTLYIRKRSRAPRYPETHPPVPVPQTPRPPTY